MIKLDGKTLDVVSENIEKMKQLFPEVFTEGKVDVDKLMLVLGEHVEKSQERYEFTWNGKTQAIQLAQKQTTGTLRPCKEESVNWDTTQNLYIEGDNLEVLRILQSSYRNKIKMIYIDPPYNTGNDFVYKDNFHDNLQNYKQKINERMKSNSETNGRFHTNWLNMIYPRLKLASSLLREDGAIFISIDDNEVHNLRKICDEIYGEENYVAKFPWRKRTAKSDVPFGVSQDYEWILCYAKSKNFIAAIQKEERKYYETPDLPNRPWRIHDLTKQTNASERPNSNFNMINPRTGESYPANPNRTWAITEDTFQRYYEEKRIVFPGDYEFLNISKPVFRYFKEDDMNKAGDLFGFAAVSTNLPKETGMTQDGTKDLTELFEGRIFGFPKPVLLIKHLISFTTHHDKSAVILDFFSGSATTAHAVMQINVEDSGSRSIISVQIPELCDQNSEAYRHGFENICEIGKERIRRAGRKILEENKDKTGMKNLDIGFKVFKLDSTNLKLWDEDAVDIEQAIWGTIDPIKEGRTQEDVVYEVLLKYGVDLTVPIEEIHIAGKKVFSIGMGYLLICLEPYIDLNVVEQLAQRKPHRIVFYDNSFIDDVVQVNAMQILKRHGIQDVRVI